MCRNIKTLFNFEPPATELEIRDAALQFVRKLSGFTVPSKANEAGVRSGRRAGRRGGARPDRIAGDERRAARPRDRGRARPRPLAGPLRRADRRRRRLSCR